MRLRPTAAAGAILAAFLFTPGPEAAHDPDWEGWFIHLDTALLTPAGTDTPLQASTQPTSPFVSAPFDTSVDRVDWDDDVAFRGGLGYAWGRKGTLRVTYWSYDDTADSEGSSQGYDFGLGGGGYNWWTVGPLSTLGYSYQYTQAWEFEQEIEAQSLDVEYLVNRPLGKPFSITLGVGVRYASFEERVEGRYVVDPFGFPARYPASRTIDSDGIGITGTLGAQFDFTDRFGIGTKLRVGFLTSDIEAEQRITDQDGYYFVAGESVREQVETEDEVATTIDFDLGFVFHTGPYLDVDVGWSYMRWSELPAGNLTRSQQGFAGGDPVIPGEERDDITWSGAHLNLTFHL